MNNSTCQVCNKQGLPIFVTRIGFDEKNGIQSPIKTPSHYPKIKNGSYVLRSLRTEGYVYVYDELDKSFYYFKKDKHGSFTKKNIGLIFAANAQNGMHQPCLANPDKVANGALITVPKANVARKIWLSFSPYLWTNRVIQRHQNAKYRSEHMTAVMVGQTQGELQCSIKNLTNTKTDELSAIKKGAILKQSERLAVGKGIIVALHDPVALMMEIQNAIESKGREFLEKDHVKKVTLSDTVLTALETGIQSNWEKKSIENRDIDYRRAQVQKMPHWEMERGLGRLPQINEEEFDRQRQVSLKQERDAEWGKYASKFNPTLRKEEVAKIKATQKAFDQKYLMPLAELMKAWINCMITTKFFKSHFDSQDMVSGVCYVQEGTLALGGVCALDPLRVLLKKKLEAPKFSDDNFVLNMLAFNQDQLKKEIQTALSTIKPALDNPFRDLPWNGLFAAFVDSLKRYSIAHTGIALDDLGARLALSLGSFFHVLSQGLLKTTSGGLAVLGFAMTYQLKLQPMRYNIRTSKVAKAVAGYMITMAQQTSASTAAYLEKNKAALQRHISARITELEKTTGKKAFQIKREMVVVEHVFNKGVTVADFVKSIETETSIKMWNEEWKKKITQKVSSTSYSTAAAIKSNFDVGGSALVAAFQGWMLTKMYSDAFGDDAMVHAKTENGIRFGLGVAALGAAVATTIEKGLERYRASTKSILSVTQRIAGRLASSLTAVAGYGTVIMDANAGYDAFQEGNHTLSFLYGASSVVGFGLTTLALMSLSIPMLGWILAIGAGIYILITVAIAKFKDNALQDWVKRCSFGMQADQRYPTFGMMQTEFEKAIKAMV